MSLEVRIGESVEKSEAGEGERKVEQEI